MCDIFALTSFAFFIIYFLFGDGFGAIKETCRNRRTRHRRRSSFDQLVESVTSIHHSRFGRASILSAQKVLAMSHYSQELLAQTADINASCHPSLDHSTDSSEDEQVTSTRQTEPPR